MLIDPHSLAALRQGATAALDARGTPKEISDALLAAVAVIARLPASSQAYRPNLGNAELAAAYVRSRYRATPRAAGALLMDDELGLIAQDSFDPKADEGTEGERLSATARHLGASRA